MKRFFMGKRSIGNALMSSTVLIIDNYDSFVFNLARYLQELGVEVIVCRNDSLTLQEIRDISPRAIVISPGPCTPGTAGISVELVQEFYQSIPILGVCLGHQAIAQALGGNVVKSPEPFHGRTSEIQHDSQGLFEGCANPLVVARYHSLIVEDEDLCEDLQVTSRTKEGQVMSLQHEKFPVYGVQFHPESILTDSGHRLLKNFLDIAGISTSTYDQLSDLSLPSTLANDFYQRQFDSDSWRPL